jgi:hypothetical protein
MVTVSGAIFGFGWNNDHQLGVMDPSTPLGDTISTPIEVFAIVNKFKRIARLPDGSIVT